MEEKKFRELPVLVKPGYVCRNIAESLSRIIEELTEKRFLIADEEKDGYEFYDKEPSYGADANMEILSEVVKAVKVEEPRFVYSASEIKHLKIKLFFIPSGGEVRYTTRPNDCDKSERRHADSFDVEVVEDIVKYDEVLLFPFLYYLINKEKCPVKINERQRMWALDDLEQAGIVIDSIEIDEESATPAFMEWFESVGLSLISSGNVRDMLSKIADEKVYVVYGEFDPKTRENTRQEKLSIIESDDEEDEDDD